MSNSVKGREYNIRIRFTEDGTPVLGFVQGFYAAGTNCIDIKPVPVGIIVQIAKKLGIGVSSELPAVNRKAVKKQAIIEEQQELEYFL